jgi:hypothetical protein
MGRLRRREDRGLDSQPVKGLNNSHWQALPGIYNTDG